jgi:hypothetical protein
MKCRKNFDILEVTVTYSSYTNFALGFKNRYFGIGVCGIG